MCAVSRASIRVVCPFPGVVELDVHRGVAVGLTPDHPDHVE
jgi:hypothetical protein